MCVLEVCGRVSLGSVGGGGGSDRGSSKCMCGSRRTQLKCAHARRKKHIVVRAAPLLLG